MTAEETITLLGEMLNCELLPSTINPSNQRATILALIILIGLRFVI